VSPPFWQLLQTYPKGAEFAQEDGIDSRNRTCPQRKGNRHRVQERSGDRLFPGVQFVIGHGHPRKHQFSRRYDLLNCTPVGESIAMMTIETHINIGRILSGCATPEQKLPLSCKRSVNAG
jgi:hypothetical protein